MQTLTKITHKEIMGAKLVRAEVKVGDETKLLPIEQDTCLVRGKIIGHETGETKLGEYVKYNGIFEAIRLGDGEKFFSNVMILPALANGIVWETYSATKKQDPNSDVIFAFVLGVKPDPTAAVGYKYTCKMADAAGSKSDPLAEIRASTDEQLASILGADKLKALESGQGTQPQLQLGDGTKADAETGEVVEKPKAKEKATA